MKKTFLLLFIAAGFVTVANAQTKSITVKGGYVSARQNWNTERLEFNYFPGAKMKAVNGFTAGAAFNLPIKSITNFSVQPELLYTQKGFGAAGSEGINSAKDIFHINYINLPLLAKYNIVKNKFGFFANLGPSFGYALNGKYSSDRTGDGVESNVSGKIKFGKDAPADYNGNDAYISKDDVRRFDVGAVAGIGASYKVGKGSIQLEARYEQGFTNFSKKDPAFGNDKSGSFLRSKNSAFSVMLGYAISIK